MTQNISTDICPSAGASNDRADSAEQNIEQGIVNFGALAFITDDVEMEFDGVDIHDIPLKKGG